jgi:hypothetical protein
VRILGSDFLPSAGKRCMDAARAGNRRGHDENKQHRANEDRDHAIHSTASIRRSLHAGQKSNVDPEIGNANAI